MAKKQQRANGEPGKRPAMVAYAIPGQEFSGNESAGAENVSDRSQTTRARESRPMADRVMEAMELIAHGHTQSRACDMAGLDVVTFSRWRVKPEYAGIWAEAKDSQSEYWRDRIITVADEEEDPQRARLKQDALKWVLAKTRPREYGDKQTVEHSGPGGGVIAHDVTVRLVPAVAPHAQLAQEGGDQAEGGEL